VLLRAEYGADTRWADVTARVRSLIQGDVLDIKVNDTNMGADPAVGQVKTLRLYVRDPRGQTQTLSYEEGQHIQVQPLNSGASPYPGGGGGYGGYGLQINQAQYGAGGRAIDVTSRLASLVRDNRLTLRVTDENMGGDPAEGKLKTLTVQYTYNGQPGQVEVSQKDVLELPSSRPSNTNLQILRAEYGINGAVWDVTARLNSRIQNNTLSLEVTDQNMGGDPAENHRKQLDVWYVFNGRQAHIVVNQKEMLNLPGRLLRRPAACHPRAVRRRKPLCRRHRASKLAGARRATELPRDERCVRRRSGARRA
jgi:hypothetical protein